MNYLSHGYRFLDDPWFLAGTAVPDWLSVVNRRMRARVRLVEPIVKSTTSETTQQLGRGILQHHHDDGVFHTCDTFMMLEAKAAAKFRRIMPDRFDHRPGFLGHVVVELLLDTVVEERNPGSLALYYKALASIDSESLQQKVNSMATRTSDKLGWFIQKFHEERFLEDYSSDGGLLLRLNQVMKRVKLPVLPKETLQLFCELRPIVRDNASGMLDAVESAFDSGPNGSGETAPESPRD